MGSSSEIKAGKAAVEIIGRDRLSPVLKGAESKLKAFGASVTSIGRSIATAGAAITAPLAAAVGVFTSQGDAVAKGAARLGIGSEALSELGYAAGQSGASMESLITGFKGVAKLTEDLASGGKTAAEVLDALGISSEAFLGASQEDRLAMLADGLAGVEDPAIRGALAMKALGRAGLDLLPMLQGGSSAINDLRKQARGLGLGIKPEDAKAAEVLGDAFDNLGSVLSNTAFRIGASLAEPLTKLVDWLTAGVAIVNQFVSKNQQLVRIMAIVGAVAIGAGAALMVLGPIITAVASTITAAVAVVGAIGATLAFLATPLGWIVAGVAAVGVALAAGAAYWLLYTESGAAALQWLGQQFEAFKRIASLTMKGIGLAIQSGNLQLAFSIAVLGLKAAWVKGVNELHKLWNIFTASILKSFSAAADGILAQFARIPGAEDMRKRLQGATKVIDTVTDTANKLLDSQTAKAERDLGQAVQAAVAQYAQQQKQTPAAEKAVAAVKATRAAVGAAPAGRSFSESIGTFSSAVAGLLGRAAGERQWERVDNRLKEGNKLLEDIKGELEDAGPLVFE